jgi:hypothetical protein
MANKKFSEFTTKTASSNVDFLVGYQGSTNVKIAPSNIGGGAAAFSFDTLKGGFYHSANVIGDVYFFNLMTTSESNNNPNHDENFAPYDNGRVKFITLIHNQTGLAPDCDGVKFYYKEDGIATENLLGTATITNAGSTHMTAKLELSDTDFTFSFGDIMAFGFETIVSGAQTGKFYGGWFHVGIEYT